MIATIVLFDWHHTHWTWPVCRTIILCEILKVNTLTPLMPLTTTFKTGVKVTRSTDYFVSVTTFWLSKHLFTIWCWTIN